MERRPALGYALVAAAAALFAVNGVVMKVILESGLPSMRLNEVRLTGAAVCLLAGLALARPAALRIRRSELPFFVVFGVCGVALVQWLYLLAIHRLEIGIALLLQYTAPLLVALWARVVLRDAVRARIWVALALALSGLALVVEVWKAQTLNGAGVAAALAAAVTFALYILLAERGVGARDAVSLSAFGFLFGALFWAAIQPWWSFPLDRLGDDVSLLGNLAGTSLPLWTLAGWMIVLGTVAPFALFVAGIRHVAATRASIVAMLEPVIASVVAWVWLDEALASAQLAGGAVVLAGVALAQTAR